MIYFQWQRILAFSFMNKLVFLEFLTIEKKKRRSYEAEINLSSSKSVRTNHKESY